MLFFNEFESRGSSLEYAGDGSDGVMNWLLIQMYGIGGKNVFYLGYWPQILDEAF